MSSHQDAGALIEGIYDAAMNPGNWAAQLKQICNSLNCFANASFETDQENLLFHRVHEIPTEQIQEYGAYYLPKDVRNQFGVQNPHLKISYDAMFLTETEKDRDEFCVWMRGYGIYDYLAAQWTLDNGIKGYTAFQKSKSQGQPTEDEIKLLSILRPHIRRGIEIIHKFSDRDLRLEASGEASNLLPFGVVLLDNDGSVMFMNRLANQITSARDGISAGLSGLKINHRDTDAAFQKLLSATTATGALRSAGGDLAVQRPSDKRSYTVSISPLPARDVVFAKHRPVVAVFISDPEIKAQASTDALCALYGLTPSEARLASQIATGISLDHCAAQLGITLETARTHLKRVFYKTGTSRQGELIHLLLSSVQSVGPNLKS